MTHEQVDALVNIFVWLSISALLFSVSVVLFILSKRLAGDEDRGICFIFAVITTAINAVITLMVMGSAWAGWICLFYNITIPEVK